MRQTIVISAVNLFEGGPLSILEDCLTELNSMGKFNVIAIVHKKSLFSDFKFSNIHFREFPYARKSYFIRLFYEYCYFRKIALSINPDLWLSLHDITPNVGGVDQAVYCHNPAPFNTLNFNDLLLQPTQILFRLMYKYIYRINIKRNKFVIVQQLWLKKKFQAIFELENNKIIISRPNIPVVPPIYIKNSSLPSSMKFFFPTYPRPFKNIEILCEAVIKLNKITDSNFSVTITIDGTENAYSRSIVRKYGGVANLEFIGLISRDKVYELFSETGCLIFPSKLETWGLPITECIQFGKPMIVSDREFAKETVGGYEKAVFFDPTDSKDLSEKMHLFVSGKDINFSKTHQIDYPEPLANGWKDLFNYLMNK